MCLFEQFKVKSFIVSNNGKDVQEINDPGAQRSGWKRKEGI
jgi:hypothetical protein